MLIVKSLTFISMILSAIYLRTSTTFKTKLQRNGILLYPDRTSVLKQSTIQPWFEMLKKWFIIFCYKDFTPAKTITATLKQIKTCNFSYNVVQNKLKKQVNFIEVHINMSHGCPIQKLSPQTHLLNFIESAVTSCWLISL